MSASPSPGVDTSVPVMYDLQSEHDTDNTANTSPASLDHPHISSPSPFLQASALTSSTTTTTASSAPVPLLSFDSAMLSRCHSKQSSSSTSRHSNFKCDGYSSRPNSFASSYRTQLSRKNSFSSFSSGGSRNRRRSQCLSGQEKHHGGKPKTFRKDYEKESNAAFDRICLMLTDLITDASTAAGIEPNLSGDEDMTRTADWARIESEFTDSDESAGESHERAQDGASDDSVLEEDPELTLAPQSEEEEEQWHWRRRLRTQMEKPSKRTSLFLELQNLHIDQDMDPTTAAEDCMGQDAGCSAVDESAQEDEAEPAFNATAKASSWAAEEYHSDGICCSEDMTSDSDSDGDTTFHSGVFSSGPRRCSSFPSRPVDIEQLQQGEELHQVIQQVDSELDRAAETIDGLTRDLMMVVASQQSWLQMKLEREIQSQHSMHSGAMDDDLLATLDRYYDDKRDSATQLSMESNGHDANSFNSSAEDLYIPSRSLLSSEDLSKYLQALKTIMDLKQELGFGNPGDDHSQEYSDDGLMTQLGGYTGGDEPIHSDLDGSDRRFSGSSYTLTNGSFRNSATSTLSLATRFDPCSTTPQSEDQDPLAKVGLSLKPCQITSRSVFKFLQQQDVLSSIEVQLMKPDTLANDLETNCRAMQPQPWPVLQQQQPQQSAAAQEQDMDLILTLHRDLLLKMAGLGTKWIAINVHLPLFIFWSFVFGIGSMFMQTSVAKHARKRLARPLESMSRILELENQDTPAEQLLKDTPPT